jgi:hypothetical protein
MLLKDLALERNQAIKRILTSELEEISQSNKRNLLARQTHLNLLAQMKSKRDTYYQQVEQE